MVDSSFLEWPFFDPEHRDHGRAMRAWTAENIMPLKAPDRDPAALDEHCRQLVAMLGEAGWLKACVPGEYGGDGPLDVRRLCLSREILSYASGLADFAFAMQGLGSGPIILYGDERLKRRYLPRVANGSAIAAFAISEAGAGSDVAAMTTTAIRDGDNYVINGAKKWISNAGLADHYVVFARDGEAPADDGLVAFVIDADTPGLTVSERIEVIAPHPLGSLEFNDCRVPAANMLGRPGDGFKVAMATLDIFRATVGAAALGLARRGFDEALGHATRRQAFGRPISGFQMTQVKIADMAVAIDAAALLIYRAAWAKDLEPAARRTREASMAKLFATEQAQQVIDQAVQIFGGLGVVSGNAVEQLYREIRALRIYEGTSEIQKLVIAGDILKAHGNDR